MERAGNRENGIGFRPTKIAGDCVPTSATHFPSTTPASVLLHSPFSSIPAFLNASTSKSTISCVPPDSYAVTPIIETATLNLSGNTGASFGPDNTSLGSPPAALMVSAIANRYCEASGSDNGYRYIVPRRPFSAEATKVSCCFVMSLGFNCSSIASVTLTLLVVDLSDNCCSLVDIAKIPASPTNSPRTPITTPIFATVYKRDFFQVSDSGKRLMHLLPVRSTFGR